jgi:hypothetical protein
MDRVSIEVKERMKEEWWRTALCLAQHEHFHWSSVARVRLLFRPDLLVDPITHAPRLSFPRFARGTLF